MKILHVGAAAKRGAEPGLQQRAEIRAEANNYIRNRCCSSARIYGGMLDSARTERMVLYANRARKTRKWRTDSITGQCGCACVGHFMRITLLVFRLIGRGAAERAVALYKQLEIW